MILSTACVCLAVDAVTFTAMSYIKPHAKRVVAVAKPVTDKVHDACVVHGTAAKHAYRMYRDIVRSVKETDHAEA